MPVAPAGDARSTVNKLVYHPAQAEPAVFRSNANGLALQLPAPGLAYSAIPVTLADASAGRNASGETAGVNSAGVAVSGTETILNSAAALAADPYNAASGLTEDALPSLLLPQATSARQGVALAGRWVESASIGAGEGFGLLVADAGGAWYLETASGHHWLARRAPDAAIFVSANQGRFQVGACTELARAGGAEGWLLGSLASHGTWTPPQLLLTSAVRQA